MKAQRASEEDEAGAVKFDVTSAQLRFWVLKSIHIKELV